MAGPSDLPGDVPTGPGAGLQGVVQGLIIAALTLATCEVALRLAMSSLPLRHQLAHGQPLARKLANLESVTRMDRDALLGVPLAHDARLGWTVEPSVTRDPVQISVQPSGIRSATPVDPLAPFGGQRVAVVGDSFGFGSDVDDDDTFTATLDRSRADRQVWNLSVVGYGHDQMWQRTVRDVLPLQPDVVVFTLLECDIVRNTMPFTVWFKPRYALQDGQLTLAEAPPASMEDAIRAHRWRPRVLDAVQVMGEAIHTMRHGPIESRGITRADQALTTAIVTSWVRDVQAAGAIPVVLLAETALNGTDRFRPDQTSVAPIYQQVCAIPGVSCVDARAAMRAAVDAGAPFQSPHGSHWSAEMHTVLAGALGPALDALVPVP